jgi:hypothetical protein
MGNTETLPTENDVISGPNGILFDVLEVSTLDGLMVKVAERSDTDATPDPRWIFWDAQRHTVRTLTAFTVFGTRTPDGDLTVAAVLVGEHKPAATSDNSGQGFVLPVQAVTADDAIYLAELHAEDVVWWDEHNNDSDDWCPWSGKLVAPTKDDDDLCPAGCRRSEQTDCNPHR